MKSAASDHDELNLLLSDILSRASVTPDDKGCQQAFESYLTSTGFEFISIDRGETKNLFCCKQGKGPGPFLLFAGHTDVVPPGEGWNTDPFTPTLRDNRLIARGTQDMKTSDVCFAFAAKQFIRDYPGFNGSIGMLLTSDEEGDGKDGTVYAIEELKKKNIFPDFCIVGEPTCTKNLGDTIKNGRRGSLNCKVTIHGEQGHVAYTPKLENPVHLAGKLINGLTQIKWDNGFDGFPPTSFQISNIHAGTGAVNVIPGTCELKFNFRYSPALTNEEIEKKVEELISGLGQQTDVSWTRSAFPFKTKGNKLATALSSAIEEVTGMQPQLSTSGGTSDARFISRWCPEVLEFGPVNNLIHKANESIPVKDISTLAGIYYQTLVNIFIGR